MNRAWMLKQAHHAAGSALYNFGKYEYPLSYSMNYRLIDAYTGQTMVLDNVRRQGRVLLFIHESRDTINDGDFNWGSDLDIPSNVHYDGSTVVYLDTHSCFRNFRTLKTEQGSGAWDPMR